MTGGREFQSRGAITGKALLPREVWMHMGWTEPMNQMILWTERKKKEKYIIVEKCCLLNLTIFKFEIFIEFVG